MVILARWQMKLSHLEKLWQLMVWLVYQILMQLHHSTPDSV